MNEYFLLLVMVLALIAVLLRADFLLTLIYLFVGVFAAGRYWTSHALRGVRARRHYPRRAFLGEEVPVRLEISNASWLPVVWLQLQESLPVDLRLQSGLRQVITLAPKTQANFHYVLEARRRGLYPLGPLAITTGDLFGLTGQHQRQDPSDLLTVYPKIVPLTKVTLPARVPMGTLRHHRRLYEDPSRVRGKRDYVAGDSLRQVDWKSSASTGRLQVKLYEPSIALESAIFLNMHSPEYEARARLDSTELAIIVAASLANWVVGQRQAVGLITNGVDPLQLEADEDRPPSALAGRQANYCPLPVPPRRGRAHLIRILEVLARLQTGETLPMVDLLRRELVHLSWGTSLLVITPHLDDALFEVLFQARRAGLDPVLLPCGPVNNPEAARRRAENFGFPFYQIFSEKDLDQWRM